MQNKDFLSPAQLATTLLGSNFVTRDILQPLRIDLRLQKKSSSFAGSKISLDSSFLLADVPLYSSNTCGKTLPSLPEIPQFEQKPIPDLPDVPKGQHLNIPSLQKNV